VNQLPVVARNGRPINSPRLPANRGFFLGGTVTDERVAIFIDGSNLYNCLKQEFGKASLSLEKFAQQLVGARALVRTYYYNAPLPQANDADEKQRAASQQKFFDSLRRIPYLELRLGRLERRENSMVEKGVDIKIAVDMLRLAYNNTYDTAILVSGDGDFADAVQAVKDTGKHVENASVKICQSFHLRQTCDRFILMDSAFLAPLWLQH
jgi:uncharacterized LabA/DUF88 family protein